MSSALAGFGSAHYSFDCDRARSTGVGACAGLQRIQQLLHRCIQCLVLHPRADRRSTCWAIQACLQVGAQALSTVVDALRVRWILEDVQAPSPVPLQPCLPVRAGPPHPAAHPSTIGVISAFLATASASRKQRRAIGPSACAIKLWPYRFSVWARPPCSPISRQIAILSSKQRRASGSSPAPDAPSQAHSVPTRYCSGRPATD